MMASGDGAYDCVAKTPMGDQKGVFTVVSSGDRFNGTFAGMMGSLDVVDGKVAGNSLTWKMEMTMPMPMTLECEAAKRLTAVVGESMGVDFGLLWADGAF